VENWYDSKCATYCVARDDVTGHYKCDPNTGNKICHKRWAGPACSDGKYVMTSICRMFIL